MRLHGGAKLPGDDVAGIFIEDGRQIEPAPADDLERGEVSLLQLFRRCGLITELIICLDDDEGWAGDQILSLQKPVNRGFRDEVALGVGEHDSQFPE